LISDLQQVVQALPSAATAGAGAAQPGGNGAGAPQGEGAQGADDEEVVDAEFTRE
jgi:hypothetical protein